MRGGDLVETSPRLAKWRHCIHEPRTTLRGAASRANFYFALEERRFARRRPSRRIPNVVTRSNTHAHSSRTNFRLERGCVAYPELPARAAPAGISPSV